MEIISGLESALSISNLLFCLLGVTFGTLIGVLPGLGPLAALAILLPFTYTLGDPVTSIIFLAGIYYGAQYGGSTTSIILNLPGEPASAITAVEGYQMTKKGQAGKALGIAAISSFFAGIVSLIVVALVTPPLSKVIFLFGPAELAMLMFLTIVLALSLSNTSFLKGLGMILIGALIGMIGIDVNSGIERFTFGIPSLMDGLPFVIIASAVFGLSEILYSWFNEKKYNLNNFSLTNIYPSKKEIRHCSNPILRGTAIGSFFGLLPGPSSIISAFCSYSVEKKIAKDKSNFGKGAIEGVAGPEAANNAAAQTNFIPLLSLGLPTNAGMALILSSLLMFGIQPGPEIITQNSSLFWALIASMFIGNIMLLILNLPLVKLWVMLLKTPIYIINICVFFLCFGGVFYVTQDWFLVFLLIPFTIIGYILKILGCEPAPLALGFVVVKMFEEYFQRALVISQGSFTIFFSSDISLFLLILSGFVVVFYLIFLFKGKYNV
jgi:putative tricarboxylic transport membrane protein